MFVRGAGARSTGASAEKEGRGKAIPCTAMIDPLFCRANRMGCNCRSRCSASLEAMRVPSSHERCSHLLPRRWRLQPRRYDALELCAHKEISFARRAGCHLRTRNLHLWDCISRECLWNRGLVQEEDLSIFVPEPQSPVEARQPHWCCSFELEGSRRRSPHRMGPKYHMNGIL